MSTDQREQLTNRFMQPGLMLSFTYSEIMCFPLVKLQK